MAMIVCSVRRLPWTWQMCGRKALIECGLLTFTTGVDDMEGPDGGDRVGEPGRGGAQVHVIRAPPATPMPVAAGLPAVHAAIPAGLSLSSAVEAWSQPSTVATSSSCTWAMRPSEPAILWYLRWQTARFRLCIGSSRCVAPNPEETTLCCGREMVEFVLRGSDARNIGLPAIRPERNKICVVQRSSYNAPRRREVTRGGRCTRWARSMRRPEQGICIAGSDIPVHFRAFFGALP